MPRRGFEDVADFEGHVSEAGELIFDGTENPVERPQSNDGQKVKYSGKKKTHTDAALVLSDKKRKIYYVSRYYDGSNVDMGILKMEFPPDKAWFAKLRVLFDLGFVGVGKTYEFLELVIGEKKPRRSKSNPEPKLTDAQKGSNKKISKERIFVEHAIGGMKIYRILKNRCRLKCQQMKNRILGLCAGLWNYHLSLNN